MNIIGILESFKGEKSSTSIGVDPSAKSPDKIAISASVELILETISFKSFSPPN